MYTVSKEMNSINPYKIRNLLSSKTNLPVAAAVWLNLRYDHSNETGIVGGSQGVELRVSGDIIIPAIRIPRNTNNKEYWGETAESLGNNWIARIIILNLFQWLL